MQSDDTLILIDSKFAAAKEKTIVDAKIMTKSRNALDWKISIKFNDTIIARLDSDSDENEIYLNHIIQLDHLQLIKIVKSDIINSRDMIKSELSFKEQYVTQRARNVHLTSICQSKASFDLFVVAQSVDHSFSDITILNKQLQ
jgi:hypothetical protein